MWFATTAIAGIFQYPSNPVAWFGYYSDPLPLEVDGVDGIYVVMAGERLDAATYAEAGLWHAVLAGDLIASQPWVTEQIAAI